MLLIRQGRDKVPNDDMAGQMTPATEILLFNGFFVYITKRTLQTYRDNGTLAYSQINHKIFYKPEDVEAVINKLKSK